MKTLLLNSLHSQRGTFIVSDPNIVFILAISVPLGDITDFNDVISESDGSPKYVTTCRSELDCPKSWPNSHNGVHVLFCHCDSQTF